MDPLATGRLSCNPAIGGLAKSHLVKEIDALGGIMGHAADISSIQFKTLNKTNLYAIGWRLQTAKKPETRAKRMAVILEMLNKGEKFH